MEYEKQSDDVLDYTFPLIMPKMCLSPTAPSKSDLYISKFLENAICLDFSPIRYPSKFIYLTDEAELTDKGAIETVSHLHHYFNSDNSVKCNDLNPNCNNCRGQNTNNAVVQYLCYRTLKGLN